MSDFKLFKWAIIRRCNLLSILHLTNNLRLEIPHSTKYVYISKRSNYSVAYGK